MPESSTITITAAEFREFNKHFDGLVTKIQHYDLFHKDANLTLYFSEELSFLRPAVAGWLSRFPPYRE